MSSYFLINTDMKDRHVLVISVKSMEIYQQQAHAAMNQ